MLRDAFEAFNEYLQGAGVNFYTSTEFNERLARHDQLAIVALATNKLGTGGTLDVQIEISGDGVNWTSKRGSPEISLALPSGQQIAWYGDKGDVPSMQFVRLRIQMTNVQAGQIIINVALRDIG